jgi:hypothetical protein
VLLINLRIKIAQWSFMYFVRCPSSSHPLGRVYMLIWRRPPSLSITFYCACVNFVYLGFCGNIGFPQFFVDKHKTYLLCIVTLLLYLFKLVFSRNRNKVCQMAQSPSYTVALVGNGSADKTEYFVIQSLQIPCNPVLPMYPRHNLKW